MGIDGEAPRFASMGEAGITAWIDGIPGFRGKGVGTKIREADYADALGLRDLDQAELERLQVPRPLARKLLTAIRVAFEEAGAVVAAEARRASSPACVCFAVPPPPLSPPCLRSSSVFCVVRCVWVSGPLAGVVPSPSCVCATFVPEFRGLA